MVKQCIGKRGEAEMRSNIEEEDREDKVLDGRMGIRKDKMKGKAGLRGVRELKTKGDKRTE